MMMMMMLLLADKIHQNQTLKPNPQQLTTAPNCLSNWSTIHPTITDAVVKKEISRVSLLNDPNELLLVTDQYPAEICLHWNCLKRRGGNTIDFSTFCMFDHHEEAFSNIKDPLKLSNGGTKNIVASGATLSNDNDNDDDDDAWQLGHS